MAKTYQVTRITTVDASTEDVFDQLVDFHKWQAWSPWEGLDPTQQRTYSGADSGVGAAYAWSGNRKVGSGSMTVRGADGPDANDGSGTVVVDVNFLTPVKSTSVSTFTLQPAGAGTSVSWTMTGEYSVMTRVFSLIKSMDSLIGPDFERGLAKLKTVVETR